MHDYFFILIIYPTLEYGAVNSSLEDEEITDLTLVRLHKHNCLFLRLVNQ